jgi:hypothetical protein
MMRMQPGEFAVRLLELGLLSLAIGCVTVPREPYLWRDDITLPVGVHRADVARAEGKVMEYLAATGELESPDECMKSGRIYQVATVEAPLAYEVRVATRPGLCRQAPEDTTLPPIAPGEEAPREFAVSKKDFHIIRERIYRADDYVELELKSEKPKPAPPPSASVLAFTSSSLSTTAGACAGPVSVEIRESSRDPKPLAEPLTLKWAAVPASAVFFSDAKCTTAVASIEMAAKTSSAEIYFRAVQVGPLQITASAKGLSDATQTHAVGPARAVAVAFTTPPQNVAADTCSSVVTVQTRDAFDNPASVLVETPVQLLAAPKSGVTFYARPDCKGAPVTSTSIPASGNSASFYFQGRLPRTVNLAATLGAVTASQDVVITSARP